MASTAFSQRLLERIRFREEDPGWRDTPAASAEIQSIKEHLQRLLNTRVGSAPIQADFGLPDFTNVPGESLGEAAQEMERQIRAAVSRYEPRLTQVAVSFEPAAGELMTLRFRIEGRLRRNNDIPVALETVVNSSGRTRVQA